MEPRQFSTRRRWRIFNFNAGAALATVCLFAARAGLGANGTADYFTVADPSGTSYDQNGPYWATSETGTPGDFVSTDQMTFATNATDANYPAGTTFSVNLDGGNDWNGLIVNTPNANITFTGTSNTHLDAAQTWMITNGAVVTVDATRQAFDSGSTVKGLNWNNEAVTFLGGGTINFETPMGCNAASAVQTENMIQGGVINFQMAAPALSSSANTYKGGFVLTNGTLNFASAGSAYAFSGLTNGQSLSLNGGTFDNTSGNPLLLSIGTYSANVGGNVKIGGNFTFTGSGNLDFGTVPVALTGNYTITNLASTLAFGGVISGSGFGLTKVGNGILSFYGANTYTGGTLIYGGTLALTNNGSVSSTAQLVVRNSTLDISGVTSGHITLTTYSTTNSTLNVALSSTANINVQTTTLNVGGPTNIVNITTLPEVTQYPQIYTVVRGTTVNGTLNFGLGTLPTSPTIPFGGYITNVAGTGSVEFVLTNGPTPVLALTWSGLSGGVANSTWDVANTPTWLNGATPSVFDQLDLVTFDDTAAGSTVVNLSAGLEPGSLMVSNNALAYVFTGGELSDPTPGTLTLTKQGAGTLLLQEGSDNFSGGIADNSGTVIIDNDSSGITGGVSIGVGATLEMGTNDTASLALPQGTVTDNGALVFNTQNPLAIASAIVGSGAVNQINSNSTVQLSGPSSGNWSVNIYSGTIQSANNTSLGSIPGGTVTATNGGTFDMGGDGLANDANFGTKEFIIGGTGVGGNGAIVNSSGTQQEDALEILVLSNNATIGGAGRWDMRNGAPLLNLNGFTLTKTNANHVAVVSGHVTSGSILIEQGIMSFEVTPIFDPSDGTISVSSIGTVGEYEDTLGSFTRSIILEGGTNSDLAGAGSSTFLDAPILLTANSTLQAGAIGGTEYYDGAISDGGGGYGITQVGLGTNILAGANTYGGPTIIAQGNLWLTNRGSVADTPLIVATNYTSFGVAGLAVPFSGTNFLILGDDVNGSGTFYVGTTGVTNYNSITLNQAVLNLAVGNANIPCITVTNLNLGDGTASSTINITALPVLLPAQFPLIKYASATGTYNLSLENMPPGYSGNLINNTDNNSIDLQITGLPPGLWNGGDSAVDNNWSDSLNWTGVGLSGNDALNFNGTAGLNNTNDLGFMETAQYIAFLPGAGAFVLNGEAVAMGTGAGITNNSSNLQTVNLGVDFGANGTNITFSGGAAGLIIGGGVTNTFSTTPGYTTLTLAGNGMLTNLLNSTTTPGGTNIVLLSSSNANWTLLDNASSVPMTVPWNFQINQGTFTFGLGSSAPTLTNSSSQGAPQDNQVGDVSGGVGTLNISNGVWTTVARINTALVNTSTGIVNQVGGILNIGNQFQGANGGTSNAQSIVTISGGTMNIGVGNGNGYFYVASRDQGILTISSTGVLNCVNLDISRNANGTTRGSVGVVNLNGGTLATARVGTAIANAQAGPATSGVNPSANFNFNGGTLKATASSTNFYQGSTVAPIIPIITTVKAGGATVNDGGYAITILEPLQHDSTLGATPDGGFLKLGAGTNTLTAASTYTGNTVISNGTLVVNGSLASGSAVNVTANGTLSGTGTVGGPVTVNGAVAPGVPGTNGLLTCSASVSINGAADMVLNNATNSDLLVGGTLAYGGTLNVALLGGTPASGNSFQLFTAASYTGNFTATNLPALSAGLGWNWNPANGTLSVVSITNPNPTNIVATVSGNTLTLAWPADHTGWILQCQTNASGAGLNPNPGAWFTVPGTSTVDTYSVTIDPNQPTVFYRLQY